MSLALRLGLTLPAILNMTTAEFELWQIFAAQMTPGKD